MNEKRVEQYLSNIINSEKKEIEMSFDNISSIHGKSKILTDFPAYLMDESKLEGTADWLFFPKSESEILCILDFLRENKIQGYISAGRTGIVGACVPSSGSVLSLDKMNNIIGFGFDKKKKHYYLRVEPGITLNEINEILKKKDIDKVSELTSDAIINFKNSKEQFYYPVDPTEMSATIGGTVATNASGARTLKYGATRKWIKRLRVILTSGDILDIQRGKYFASKEGIFIINKPNGKKIKFKIPNYTFNTSVKNAAGIYSKPKMDLIDLFIGSEGILGIITQIDVWIIEKNPLIYNVLFFKSEEDAICFNELLQKNEFLSPEIIEFFSDEALNLMKKVQQEQPKLLNIPDIPIDAKSVIFFDLVYSEDKLDAIFGHLKVIAEKANVDLSSGWSGFDDQDHDRFKHFRHALPEYINSIIAERKQNIPQLHKLGTDMSVPTSQFRNIMQYYHLTLREAKLKYVIFGHLGDNHVHVNILPNSMEEMYMGEKIYKKFAKKAVEYGGTISAEHGIGKIKKEFLKIMYSQNDIDEMRQIKKTLDPCLILNIGNIIDIEVKMDKKQG
ncbi:MAG: FAD-binding oxidoreductase [Promethearchaeota archaeon]